MLEYPDPYRPLPPKVACRRLSFLGSSLPTSFLGTGGGGKGPAGGAGLIGRVWLNVAAVALDDPLGAACSGAFRVVSLGIEFVVETLGGRPGWPEERPTLLEPFFIGDLEWLTGSLYCGEVIAERTSPPPIGISPDVGVGSE